MSEQKQAQQIVLKNVRVKYAKLIRPGQAFDEGQPDLWSANMYVTDEDRDKLMAMGCNPKEDKNHEEFFVAKRNVVNKRNENVKPPMVVDGRKQPFTEEVGNGSVCNLAVTPFPWSKGKKSGVILYLNAVQVVNHVPMSSGIDAFEVVDEQTAEANDGLPF